MMEKSKRGNARPFLKWAGGKSQVLRHIRAVYPEGLGASINKYAEPFLGGGAVLFDVLNRFEMDAVYVGDVNGELVCCYEVVRDGVEALIAALEGLQAQYLPLAAEARAQFYYAKRAAYNALLPGAGTTDKVGLAALFLFLNHTCYNGLYRVNRAGHFNVPVGLYRAPRICDAGNLREAARLLRGVAIHHAPYTKVQVFADEQTFVYLDPPYRPLTPTAKFTAYAKGDFDDAAQEELAAFVRRLSSKGVRVALSNADPKNTNPADTFLDDLYAGFVVQRVPANRRISRAAGSRGAITELLVRNY